MSKVPEPLVRASEMGQYAYCARSWWLMRIKGIASRNRRALAAGTVGHRRNGRQVVLARTLRRWAAGLALAAVVVVILMLAILLVRQGS